MVKKPIEGVLQKYEYEYELPEALLRTLEALFEEFDRERMGRSAFVQFGREFGPSMTVFGFDGERWSATRMHDGRWGRIDFDPDGSMREVV